MPFASVKSVSRVLGALSAAALSVALTGCGVGVANTSTSSLANMGGLVHGGPEGDAGATVTLYATTTAAYGTGGTQLAQTTTDPNGFFNFGNTAATCPSGQQAYITVNGGNPGLALGNNPQILLMAALGDCSGISTSTAIYINEATTVAAGYALSNFMSIDGSGVVHVSAPSTNNQQSGSCSVDSGTGLTTCNAAGLRHAFQNAANLVFAVSPDGSQSPTGTAYTTVPGNTNGMVPTLVINSLANIIEACVNSIGGVAGDAPATPCGKLFTDTTPPSIYAVSPITPTNTLQAIINLAKFPTMTPPQLSGTTPGLFSIVPATPYYTPALAAAPPDWTMGIAWTGPTSSTNFIYTFFTVLDINDTTYNFGETANGSGAFSVSGMNANGSVGYKAATSGPVCAAASACAGGVDALGNLWLANATGNSVYEFKQVDGTLENTFAIGSGTAPNSAVVDKYNNVYITLASASINNLYSKTPTASAFTAVQSGPGPSSTAETTAPPEYITIASDGSLWNSNFASGTSNITYLANSSTTATPTFAAPVVTPLSASVGSLESISIDGSNNAWANNQATLWSVKPGNTTPTGTFTITGIGGSSTTAKTASSARFTTLDGDGNIILPDNTTASVIWQFYAAKSAFTFFAPCIGNSGTACLSATGTPHVVSPRNAVTDSTGSIWISVPVAIGSTNNLAGSVTQLIGTGAPTWPQTSLQMPGVRP